MGFQRFASSSNAVSTKPGGTLRPRIEVGPRERAGKCGMRRQAQICDAFAA